VAIIARCTASLCASATSVPRSQRERANAAPSGRFSRIAAKKRRRRAAVSKPGHRPAPKACTIDVFVALHRLHFSRSIIGQLTGFSSAYVGQILFDAGRRERWDNVADVRAALPLALRESCDELACNHAAPRATQARTIDAAA
jgi:hypothetical protein